MQAPAEMFRGAPPAAHLSSQKCLSNNRTPHRFRVLAESRFVTIRHA